MAAKTITEQRLFSEGQPFNASQTIVLMLTIVNKTCLHNFVEKIGFCILLLIGNVKIMIHGMSQI